MVIRYHTPIPAFIPILETFLKLIANSSCFDFSFLLLSFLRCLQFWEEEKVSGDAWLWFCFWPKTNAQKLMCELLYYIMMQNPWFIFPQFCAFLTNCFAQTAHNFKVVFLIENTQQSKKTMSKTFTFHRTWHALFGLDSFGRFHWNNWTLVSMS